MTGIPLRIGTVHADRDGVTPTTEGACNEVSTVLWRERDLLEGLAFTLEVQRLVLCEGDDRWLPRACRQVEEGLARLRSAELVRAVRVDILAEQLHIEPSPSLRSVAEVVPEPWSEIFRRHRRAFLELIGEVMRVAEHNRVHLGHRRDATLDGPDWLRPRPDHEPVEDPFHVLLDDGGRLR